MSDEQYERERDLAALAIYLGGKYHVDDKPEVLRAAKAGADWRNNRGPTQWAYDQACKVIQDQKNTAA